MKTLSYAFAATLLLAASPVLAGESNPGENQFHGAPGWTSYGAEAAAPQAAATVEVQTTGRQAAGQVKPILVWGDKAVDPIYFNQPGLVSVKVESAQAASLADIAADDDFIRAYAN